MLLALHAQQVFEKVVVEEIAHDTIDSTRLEGARILPQVQPSEAREHVAYAHLVEPESSTVLALFRAYARLAAAATALSSCGSSMRVHHSSDGLHVAGSLARRFELAHERSDQLGTGRLRGHCLRWLGLRRLRMARAAFFSCRDVCPISGLLLLLNRSSRRGRNIRAGSRRYVA